MHMHDSLNFKSPKDLELNTKNRETLSTELRSKKIKKHRSVNNL